MGPWKPNKVEQISTQRGYEKFTSDRTNKNELLRRGRKSKQKKKANKQLEQGGKQSKTTIYH